MYLSKNIISYVTHLVSLKQINNRMSLIVYMLYGYIKTFVNVHSIYKHYVYTSIYLHCIHVKYINYAKP